MISKFSIVYHTHKTMHQRGANTYLLENGTGKLSFQIVLGLDVIKWSSSVHSGMSRMQYVLTAVQKQYFIAYTVFVNNVQRSVIKKCVGLN